MSQENEKKMVSFLSFQRYYMIAVSIAIVFSIYVALTFGIGAGEIFAVGTWFVLGGFTLWVPTSGLMMPFFLIMFLYILSTCRKITLSSTAKSLMVKEKYWYQRKSVQGIEKSEIECIKFQNGYLGIKLIWVIIFGAHLIYMMSDGLKLLTNPHVFGYGVDNGLLYVFTGIIDLIIILLIIVPGENHIEIHTKEHIYKLKFSIWLKNKQLTQDIKKLLFNEEKKSEGDIENVNLLSSATSNGGGILTNAIVYGIIFIVIAMISRIFDIFAGSQLRTTLYFLGAIFIILELYENSSNKIDKKNSQSMLFNSNKGKLEFKQKTHLSEKYFSVFNLKKEHLNLKNAVRKLNPLATLLLLLNALFMGWSISAWFRFMNSVYLGWLYSIISILLIILILFVSLEYVSKEIATVNYKSPSDEGIFQLSHLNFQDSDQKAKDKNKYLKERVRLTVKMLNIREIQIRWIMIIAFFIVGIILAIF